MSTRKTIVRERRGEQRSGTSIVQFRQGAGSVDILDYRRNPYFEEVCPFADMLSQRRVVIAFHKLPANS